MIELLLTRQADDGFATLGQLHLYPAPNFLCWTLERAWKDNAVNLSCIPPGDYPLRLRDDVGWAQRLGRPVVEIHDVPGRSLILWHPANWWWQLKGCPAPGLVQTTAEDGTLAVGHSRDALEAIEPHLIGAAERGSKIRVEGVR